MRLKNLIFSFVALCIVVGMYSIAFAGGTYVQSNARVYTGEGSAPSSGDYYQVFEDENHITYKWKFTYVDSSDAVHSLPFYIGGANVVDGRITAKQSATGDANILLHYAADDRNTWEIDTPNGLDAVSSTLKADTLGYDAGADEPLFHAARWLVVEAAGGGTNNQDGNVMTIVLSLKKQYPSINANGTERKLAHIASKYLTQP